MLRGVDAVPPEGVPRALYNPPVPPSLRESAIDDPSGAALLIIDAQNYNCTRAGALWSSSPSYPSSRSSPEELRYFFSRLQGSRGGGKSDGGGDDGDRGDGGGGGGSGSAGVIRNWVSLAAAARSAGARTAFTVMSSATGEKSDASRQVTSLDYRLSGFLVPPQSWDARLVDELLFGEGGEKSSSSSSSSSSSPSSSPSFFGPPRSEDLFLPKTSCNVFLSTCLDFHLRSMNIKKLIVSGVVTDQCVATAVQTAADLGYLVTLVEDACAATSEERHTAALRTLRGFARVRSTKEVISELEAAKGGGRGEVEVSM